MEDSIQKRNSSEKRLKRIFKLIPHPIYIWKQFKNNLILIEYNKAAEDITEGKIKKIIGIKAKEFHKENPEILEDLNRCINDKIEISRELNFRFKTTGKEKVLNFTYIFVPPDMVLVYTDDISEKRKTEEHLKQSEIEKSIILDNIPELIAFQDKEHTLLWVNKAAEDSVGALPKQLIGRKCFEIWQKRNDVCEDCPVDAALMTGNPEIREVITSDGRIWNIKGFPVRDNNNNVIGAAELTTEITEQKHIQQKLKESEEKFRTMADQSLVGIIIIQDGKVVYVNQAESNIMEYSLQEMMEWTQEDLLKHLHPDDRYKAIIRMRKSHEDTDQPPNFTYRIWTKSRKVKIVDTYTKVIKLNEKSALLSYVLDITDKKRSERRLMDSERKYRDLYENALIGLWTSEIKGGKFIRANNIASRIAGYENADDLMNNSTAIDLFNYETRVEFIRQLKEHGTKSGFEAELIDKNGYKREVSVSGRIYQEKGIIEGAFIEISDLKRTQKALIESQKMLQLVMDNIPQYIFWKDRNYVYRGCNKSFANLVGAATPKNIIDKTDYDLPLINEQADSFRETDRYIMNTDSPEYHIIEHIIDANGKEAWVDTNKIPIHDSEGNVVGIIGSLQDITEKRKKEQQLRESEIKVREEYNRSNLYKDLFTHDINNILQNIFSSVELSTLYFYDPNKKQDVKRVTNIIREQITRGKKLVSNVQKISEVEEIKTSISSIEALNVLKKAKKLVKESFPHKVINIEIKSLQNEYFLNANHLLINIFENILLNAVIHNDNETIEILVRISKYEKNRINYVIFEFLDNGIGIPDSMKDEIFLREYKKSEIPTGIGLGLLLVKRIIETYNGEIKVEDKIQGDPSKGSNFIVLIPEKVKEIFKFNR